MRVTINDIEVDIYDNDVILWDSYKIKLSSTKEFVEKLCEYSQHSEVLTQDKQQLQAELIVHNILYKLGICQEKTNTTNLSLYKDMANVEKFVYATLSIFL